MKRAIIIILVISGIFFCQSRPSSSATEPLKSLKSPDRSKIISYSQYNGYAGPQQPAAVFTVTSTKTGQKEKLPFFIAVENTGRGIDQWSWIDNRYVLISGDGMISILDTDKLKTVNYFLGTSPQLSKDRKSLNYTEIQPPLYGPGSGHTKITTVLLSAAEHPQVRSTKKNCDFHRLTKGQSLPDSRKER